jgi:glycosyltransferase involved in cell wall biosynthesis
MPASADTAPGIGGCGGENTLTPHVSVIVPHFEDLANLNLCLAALEAQSLPCEAFEIIVADNASPSGPAAVERVIAGRARLVVVPERGAGAARNGGAAHARGTVLAFTDSDCRPEPQWLAEGLEALAGVDFVGGRMTVLVDDAARLSPAEAFETVYAFRNEFYVKRRGFTVTANLFCHRTVFDRVGGFVASGVSEDNEWCYRARDLGFRIGYAERAGVGHPARRTWPELLKKWRRINAETYGLMTSAPLGRLKWVLRIAATPFSAIFHTPMALFSRRLRSLSQRLAALGILYRLRWWRTWDSVRLLAGG